METNEDYISAVDAARLDADIKAKEKVVQIEEAIVLSGSTAASVMVLIFRLLELKSTISLIAENSDEVYQLELRKIADIDSKSKKSTDPSLINNIKITIDKYE